MKSKRFQFKYRASASKLHKKVGDLMRSSATLKGYNFFQEYPVSMLNPEYEGTREHFDWTSTDLKVVVECHGEQHYRPVTFGGISVKQATENFEAQQARDEAKKSAAISAGYGYLAIRFDEEVSEEILIKKITEAVLSRKDSEVAPAQKIDWASEYQKKKNLDKDSGRTDTIREKAREHARAQYQKLKAWKKAREVETDES